MHACGFALVRALASFAIHDGVTGQSLKAAARANDGVVHYDDQGNEAAIPNQPRQPLAPDNSESTSRDSRTRGDNQHAAAVDASTDSDESGGLRAAGASANGDQSSGGGGGDGGRKAAELTTESESEEGDRRTGSNQTGGGKPLQGGIGPTRIATGRRRWRTRRRRRRRQGERSLGRRLRSKLSRMVIVNLRSPSPVSFTRNPEAVGTSRQGYQ